MNSSAHHHYLHASCHHGDEVEVKSFFRFHALNYFNEILCVSSSQKHNEAESLLWRTRQRNGTTLVSAIVVAVERNKSLSMSYSMWKKTLFIFPKRYENYYGVISMVSGSLLDDALLLNSLKWLIFYQQHLIAFYLFFLFLF